MMEAKPYPKAQQLERPNRKPTRPSLYRQKQMRDRKQGPCRICGNPPPNNLHHVLPRSYGLVAWTESNLLPLCGSGTTGCHGRVEARDAATIKLMVEALSNSEYAHAVHHGGEGFFERRGLRYQPAEGSRVNVGRSSSGFASSPAAARGHAAGETA